MTKNMLISVLILSAALATCSDTGEKVDLDDLTLAARRGDPAAQYKLGLYYLQQCRPANPVLAVEWLARAGEQGHVEAQSWLGSIYEKGRREKGPNSVAANAEQAAYWYAKLAESLQKIAEHGSAANQFRLGTLYEKGQGVPQDADQAYAWHQKAAEQWRTQAEQGNVAAHLFLSHCYEMGKGIPQDIDEAVRLLEKAVEIGTGSDRTIAQRCLQELQDKINKQDERRE